jgi:hypothetical protein
MKLVGAHGRAVAFSAVLLAALSTGAGSALLAVCGPFTDVSDVVFCPFVLEIFYLGITTGTTPTTYDPAGNVTRLQMAAFLARNVDGVLKRGSRRAALNRFWSGEANLRLARTTIGESPTFGVSDGEDVWVGNALDSSISRVHGSDGKILGTWTDAKLATGVFSAMGRIFATGTTEPGSLYRIDPSLTAGAVETVASTLGDDPIGLAYDGSRIWTANSTGSVSIVTPGASVPWTVTTVTTGFSPGQAFAVLYDGTNIWVPSITNGTLLRLDPAGAILQTVTVGSNPEFPVFDGTNIWVPRFTPPAVTVVRASSGAILATLTGNGLTSGYSAAFDGQRILVTNGDVGADSVSLWKAADLTPLGSFGTGTGTLPTGAFSDGINFWIVLHGTGQLARF